ncbi:putative membrane protein [Propionispora sp. 2/2-37]|uniref:phosphatidate cytidylyltransferase n=1 Tax=Propionispora sp. 2/2-37 TaxID=1677858 RepID=UPI0006BB7250|nr:phosphatidate cytidylyltransferase [Propionispora sp. 2/2-37]CUH96125.1 putative membrane protein [Propionispora sp. 2/2-37]
MFNKRVLTAIIGIPTAIYIIQYGQWLFAATVAFLALVCWHELYHMLRQQKIELAYYIGSVAILLLLGCAWIGNTEETIGVLFLTILVVLSKMIIGSRTFTVRQAAFTLFGFFYIGMTFSYLLWLRFIDEGRYFHTLWGNVSAGTVYIWLPFIGTWANDTFAFFVGSVLGKHKLCPAISPGKTVEGAVGGVVGSLLALTISGRVFALPLEHSIVIGLLVGIFAPLGDLTESAIKRFCDVKDSGKALPGHGGILDRFDSIMFAAPVVYYYVRILLLS